MPSSTLARGNVLVTVVLQVPMTPVSVAATSVAEQLFTVLGVQANDQVSAVGLQAAWTGLTSIVNVRATAPNQIGVSFANGTAGALVPPAGLYDIELNRPENLPLPGNAV